MSASIFEFCKVQPALIALLGADPFRMFAAGEAPQDVARPYVVWQHIGGAPENYLGTKPNIDRHELQLDVYADTLSSARALLTALRDGIDSRCHVVSFRGESREEDTKLYRISFDVSWFEE